MTEKSPHPVHSQDYWDTVISQIKRRPSVTISMILLVSVLAVVTTLNALGRRSRALANG